jgi:phosphatidylserine decarboxylase
LSSEFQSGRRGPGPILSRLAAAARVAPEGAAIALGLVAAAVILALAGFQSIGIAVLLCAFIIALFFRDPDRFPDRIENVVLSGADGRVTDIVEAPAPDRAGGGRCVRISVFMSPLNVHVNRAPVGGEVRRVQHSRGEFRAAFGDAASEHNERNLIEFFDSAGRRHAMVQVAGYLARRIVCRVRVRDRIMPAQRVGLIMFGSRVDHFLPAGYRAAVKIGDRVRAGQSIIGELEQ